MSRRCVSCPGDFEHEGPCHSPAAHTQLVNSLATTSARATDAERELDASAALLATARRRIAQLEAEAIDLRRALAENIQAGIAERVLAELARYTVRVAPGMEAEVERLAAAARENMPREIIVEPPDHVLVHADGGQCHGTALVDGRCPKCRIIPDSQSTELWPRESAFSESERPKRTLTAEALHRHAAIVQSYAPGPPTCGSPNPTTTDPPTSCTLPPGHRHGCWCKDADARSYTWAPTGPKLPTPEPTP